MDPAPDTERSQMRAYHAHTAWTAERPHALVVCCSDGRWHAQMMEFIAQQVSARADLYAVPGGPAVLDGWNSSFDEARAFGEAMRLLAKYHDLTSIWLIAHEGCAFYLEKHPHFDPKALRRRQTEDLARAREVLLERLPKIDVRLVFAALRGSTVVFEPSVDAVPEVLP